MVGVGLVELSIRGSLSRNSLPWLIAALPAVCGSCDPAISTDSGIVDARGLWIPENTPWSGYFRYLVAQRRDGNVVTAEERRLSSSLRRLSFSTVSTCMDRANVSLVAL